MSPEPAVARPRAAMEPDTLLRHYAAISIFSIAAVLLLTCYGIYQVSLARIVANAEDSGLALANAMMDHETSQMLVKSPDGELALRVTEKNSAEIDAAFKSFLHHFGVLKIKVFDRQAQIIYSTDPTIVGLDDDDNPRLLKALGGRANSEVTAKGKVLDFHGQEKFDVDVVETYVPVRDPAGRVVGCFELYKDVTPYYRQIAPFVVISGALMALILTTGFLLSFALMRREAVELKAVQERLRDQANTDFLSGTLSRRRLLQECEERMARLKRADGAVSSLGFVMVDIDHFKRINDTFGHAAGDEVIRAVAQRLTRALRQDDFVGRYGGEEFLIVLPDVGGEPLKAVVDRIWTEVRASPVAYGDERIAVTASLGVACSRPEDEAYEAVVKRADDALYLAKNQGRDTVRFAA